MTKVLTVSEISKLVEKYILNSDFKSIYIRGEISNINYNKNHLYFSLKEAINGVDYLIKCSAFNYIKRNLPTNLKEGNKVKILASIDYYMPSSNLNFVVQTLEKEDDIGLLYQELENRKKLYLEKGYFDEKYKKTLPTLVKRLGVITAKTGAAIKDIIKTAHSRDKNIDIFIYSVKVQGNDAKYEIEKAIRYFNENNNKYNLDAIIVGRGGGSIEDLWAFNEPEVIEAIYNSKIFIVSAVGHETDVLLSDFVADKRASTPTQAAEILIRPYNDLILELNNYKKILKKEFNSKYYFKKNEISLMTSFFSRAKLIKNVNNKYMYITELTDKLDKILNFKLEKFKIELEQSKDIIKKISLKNILLKEKNNLETLKSNIIKAITLKINKTKEEFTKMKILISKYSSQDILKLGYAIIKQNNNVISKKEDIELNKKIDIVFKDDVIKGVIIDEKD